MICIAQLQCKHTILSTFTADDTQLFYAIYGYMAVEEAINRDLDLG